jgi:hypothetical protein
MSDPYRISEGSEETRPATDTPSRGRVLRPVLWLVLVVSAAANAVLSTTEVNMFVGSSFGLVSLACGTALIVHHYRNRRR